MDFSAHLARLKAGVFATYTLDQIPEWITSKTYLRGRKYSFRGHEFQLKVLQDTSQEVNCQKCSQIGMTEAQGRWSLGIARLFPNFSLIYTMPYSNDAELLCRTRIDPIITDSADLKQAVNPDMDNSQIKQIGNSFIYFRGTQGNTQAISIPADAIVSDEIDRSSAHILSQYTSRLTHSAWRLRRNFSTPTVDGFGIAEKMTTSRRFRNMCKCEHCAHWFVPDYYQHVVIPGFNDKLETVTKPMLARIRWKEAKLLCPACGLPPSLMPQHREWVLENNEEAHDAAGYYISPFDAPTIEVCRPPGLIKASTEYAKISEFKNQNLGLTAQDAEESLTLEDIKRAEVPGNLKDSGLYSMGADMGLVCRIVIGRLDASGVLVIVHREKVPLGVFESRSRELASEFRCLMKVFDSQPYVDLIMRMQKNDPNLYAAVFHKTKRVEVYKVVEQSEEPEEGKLDVRQVQINRNKALDELVGQFKHQGVAIQMNPNEDEDYRNECLDLKRIPKRDESGELAYVWEKSAQGNDHYFFATLYLHVATRMRAMAAGAMAMPILVSGFRVVERTE
jgi:hypothetical protein